MQKVFDKFDKLKSEIMSEVEGIRTIPLNDEIRKAYPEIGDLSCDADGYIQRIRQKGRFPIYCIIERKRSEDTIYIPGGVDEAFIDSNTRHLMNKAFDEGEVEAEQKFLAVYENKTQIKAVNSACEFLKALSKVRSLLELGETEAGIVKLMEAMKLLIDLKPLLKKAREVVKGGAETPRHPKVNSNRIRAFMQEKINANPKRTYASVVAETFAFFAGQKKKTPITLSYIRKKHPLKSLK